MLCEASGESLAGLILRAKQRGAFEVEKGSTPLVDAVLQRSIQASNGQCYQLKNPTSKVNANLHLCALLVSPDRVNIGPPQIVHQSDCRG